MLEINDFFEFSTNLSSSTLQAHIVESESAHMSEPHLDRRLLTGSYERVSFPVRFKQYSGKKLHDVIETGTAILYLISDKMKFLLEKHSLTGWKSFEIILLDNKKNRILGYHGLSIVGRCGPVDYNKCEIIEKRLSQIGPISKYYKGLYVGLDEWDGSDFFLPKGSFGTIVTRRAADLLGRNKLTNIRLTSLKDVEFSESSLKILKLI